MLRGNGGQRVFFSEADYDHLYSLLEEGIERFGYRVHGYCCMRNHLHLAVQVGECPLSQPMQNLAFRHTRWINRRRRRVGHLFQGRYKAILVDRDSYLLELVRYVHLNPVRAGLVADPAAYPWSSHGAYLGRANVPWLTTDWVLGQFGAQVGWARRRYRRFIEEGLSEGHREAFHRGEGDPRILGDDTFLQTALRTADQVLPPAPSLDRMVATVCAVYGVDEGRGQASKMARRPVVRYSARHGT
jgi:REP element-mobilizing transposase RayT